MIDFTGGDHSFKNFFKIMWSNGYPAIMMVAGAFLTFMLINKEDKGYPDWGWYVAVSILLAVVIIIPIKCIQFWNDLKNGRSR